jgi:WD40 repeat protein
MVLSAASDEEKKEPDLQRALVLARTMNDPSILAEAIVALGWEREREICTKLETKKKDSPEKTFRFLEGVLHKCQETPLDLVYEVPCGGKTKALAFSPDGTRLAIGSEDREARLVDVTNGKVLWVYIHNNEVSCVAFSPDGTKLATTSYNGEIYLLDAVSGGLLWEQHHNEGATVVAFSSDGSQVVTAGFDKKVRYFRAETGMELRELGFEGACYVNSIAFSSNGKQWAVGTSNSKVILMDTMDNSDVSDWPAECFALSPDFTQLVTNPADRSITLRQFIDVDAVDIVWKTYKGAMFTNLVLSFDGKWIVAGLYQAATYLIDAKTGDVVREITHDSSAHKVAFSLDGTLLATGTFGKVSVWRTPW